MRVFVFGSNLAGYHGKGAALHAVKYYGAQDRVGEGRTGDAYALPTKGSILSRLSLDEIRNHVRVFFREAQSAPHVEYLVTRIGCGLAGYTDSDIGPMFTFAPQNCILPVQWHYWAGDDYRYHDEGRVFDGAER